MTFRAVQHGDRVLILVGGRLVADLEHSKALETGRAIMGIARLAEEHKLATRVAGDAALLLRCTGLGLAINNGIMAEARKLAQWDSKYRRVPAIEGIPSANKVGRPGIFHSKARK